MFYPAFKADGFAPRLARTRLGRVRTGLLALGHLRTLEVLENRLLSTSGNLEPFDLGQAVAASRLPWGAFRARAQRASILLRLSVARYEPKTEAEAKAILAWWDEQSWTPPRSHQSAEETKAAELAGAHAIDHAATPTLRLAAAVAAVPGWQSLLRVRSVWDAPLIAANHLLAAHAENHGAYHFPADLVLGAAHENEKGGLPRPITLWPSAVCLRRQTSPEATHAPCAWRFREWSTTQRCAAYAPPPWPLGGATKGTQPKRTETA